MSECVSLSRPTRVLSVILRKEAPFQSGNRVTELFHRSQEFTIDQPSLNLLLPRPPGQKTGFIDQPISYRLGSVKQLMHRDCRLAPNKCSNTFKSSDLSPFGSLFLFLGIFARGNSRVQGSHSLIGRSFGTFA